MLIKKKKSNIKRTEDLFKVAGGKGRKNNENLRLLF